MYYLAFFVLNLPSTYLDIQRICTFEAITLLIRQNVTNQLCFLSLSLSFFSHTHAHTLSLFIFHIIQPGAFGGTHDLPTVS